MAYDGSRHNLGGRRAATLHCSLDDVHALVPSKFVDKIILHAPHGLETFLVGAKKDDRHRVFFGDMFVVSHRREERPVSSGIDEVRLRQSPFAPTIEFVW